jgi:hypothetical protein
MILLVDSDYIYISIYISIYIYPYIYIIYPYIYHISIYIYIHSIQVMRCYEPLFADYCNYMPMIS